MGRLIAGVSCPQALLGAVELQVAESCGLAPRRCYPARVATGILGQVPVPRAILFDHGLVICYPDGKRLARTLERKLSLVVDPAAATEGYSRVIHLRDREARPDFSDQWFWTSWCLELGVEPGRALAVQRVVAQLDADPERFWTVLEPGVSEVLTTLRSHSIRMGIISNTDGKLAEDLREKGLADYFDVAVDSEIVGLRKPDPRIFTLALERLGERPADCWFVGDDMHLDIAPAEELGFASAIHFNRLGLHNPSVPRVQIGALRDLVELVAQ